MRTLLKNIAHACALQLILTTASLPFLLWWRIPFPLLSIVGNIIHPLFLTASLLLASGLFFTTLFSLPDTGLIYLLDITTFYWSKLFSFPIASYWVSLRWWHLPLACSLTLILLCRFLLPHIIKHKKALLSFSLCTLCTSLLWQLSAKKPGITFLRKGTQSLVCIPHTNNVELIDFGYLRGTRNKKSIMTYEVLPHLLFTYGTDRYLLKNK